MGLSTVTITSLAVLFCLSGADKCWAGSAWSYDGEKGPRFWADIFPAACSGLSQSPIDIKPEETQHSPALGDFAIWYDPPRPGSRMTLTNNGHTVQVSVDGEFYVTNGGLRDMYKTAQFHFHWGSSKHHGSEHLIDGKAFPLELHIVNYNKELYRDITEALIQPQGLAVLGVMFEKSDEDNKDLEPLIAAMDQIKDPDVGGQVVLEPLSLRSLLPTDMSRYYRYNGSLTTPNCFESVVWTVFADPRPISARQMRKFREMLQHRPGSRHRRHSLLPATAAARGRERRALQVLEELGLDGQQQTRLRRELLEKREEEKEQPQVTLDESGAGQGHHKMAEAAAHGDEAGGREEEQEDGDHENQANGGKEQDGHQTHAPTHGQHDHTPPPPQRMVNNFRPVQPLNSRVVYRSFKLAASGKPSAPGHSDQAGEETEEQRGMRRAEMQERLKYYQSTDSASSLLFPSGLLLLSYLVSLVL